MSVYNPLLAGLSAFLLAFIVLAVVTFASIK